jgi:hypothetical protein
MNDFNDPNQTQPEPPPGPGPAGQASQPAGFCQNCGKPLDTETIRRVGPAVYCEPCLEARLGSATTGTRAGYAKVRAGAFTPAGAWSTENLNAPGANPGLAALLGLIPGVGAMYNEQYAKGIVHLLVFAVFVSLADNVAHIFGLFCFGWICYMAIEAHHTARARRDGTPLPNPFGLNDIGERFGFGRAWPTGPSAAQVAHDAAAAAAAAAASFNTRTQPPPAATPVPPSAENWGAPADTYAPPAYTAPPWQEASYNQAYRNAGFEMPPVAPFPPATPYTPVAGYAPAAAFDPASVPLVQPSRFPTGAVWLIGLGIVFLLSTTGIFNGFPAEGFVGAVLLALGVWAFVSRMMETGTGVQSDGSATYPLRLIRALRVSVYLDLLGTLFLLDGFSVLRWRYTWPLLIILPGVMAIAERFANQAASQPFMPPSNPAAQSGDSPQGGN